MPLIISPTQRLHQNHLKMSVTSHRVDETYIVDRLECGSGEP